MGEWLCCLQPCRRFCCDWARLGQPDPMLKLGFSGRLASVQSLPTQIILQFIVWREG